MSLLQKLSYPEYDKYASGLTIKTCEIVAKLADLKNGESLISFTDCKKPGALLIKHLDQRGYSLQQFRSIMNTAFNTKAIITYYHPHSKVAILIANEKYEQLSKLATPSIDCDSLACNLRNLGFITITIKNTRSCDLKDILSKTISKIPEDSYCFLFYAGHGCELCNTKCILSIDCPMENIELVHCVTENWLLREIAKCKPETCILIMDMCRIHLDRKTNPEIYTSMCDLESYTIHNNLIISYSTQSSSAAYEVLQIECTTTIDNGVTYELKTGDTEKIIPGGSQYVNALCTRLVDNFDISTMLDKVHGDVENSIKKQRPIKIQCGLTKRSLYDPVKGDPKELVTKIREVLQEHKDNCAVF